MRYNINDPIFVGRNLFLHTTTRSKRSKLKTILCTRRQIREAGEGGWSLKRVQARLPPNMLEMNVEADHYGLAFLVSSAHPCLAPCPAPRDSHGVGFIELSATSSLTPSPRSHPSLDGAPSAALRLGTPFRIGLNARAHGGEAY